MFFVVEIQKLADGSWPYYNSEDDYVVNKVFDKTSL